jgi:small subunit ribosomal protein S20
LIRQKQLDNEGGTEAPFSGFKIYLSMANTKSAKKEVRKSLRRTERNRAVRSQLKTLFRKLKTFPPEEKEGKKMVVISYISALEKASKRGIVHPNRVNRVKSQWATCLFASEGNSNEAPVVSP